MAETIEQVLDATREALLSGDLQRLAELSLRTETALSALDLRDAGRAKRLRAQAQRNDRLIVAALKGVKAARRRAGELAEHGRFSTYDAGGRRDRVGLADKAPMRRA